MTDKLFTGLPAEIGRANDNPRPAGHSVPATSRTGVVAQRKSGNQSISRGSRSPVQTQFPSRKGPAHRDAPNDFNFLLQRNFVSQNTLTASRVIAAGVPGEVFEWLPLPGETSYIRADKGAQVRVIMPATMLAPLDDIFFSGWCMARLILNDELIDDSLVETAVTNVGIGAMRVGGSSAPSTPHWMKRLTDGSWKRITGPLQTRRTLSYRVSTQVDDGAWITSDFTRRVETAWFDGEVIGEENTAYPIWTGNALEPTTPPGSSVLPAGQVILYPGETMSPSSDLGVIASVTCQFRVGGGYDFEVTGITRSVGSSTIVRDYTPPNQQSV